MKKIFKLSLTAASLALMAGAASAGIVGTPHNLTSGGANPGPGPNTQSSTEQICVFCHTPHAANTTATAPLWNKGIPANTGYTTYSTANSSTIDGTVMTVGSVSAACLSCHDGSQAMDNLVNAPGSGGLNSAGSDRGYTWNVGSNKITGVANLGKDLSNDHPIGIQYCGGGLSSTTTAATNCNDKDFNSISTKNINGTDVFWVETGTADAIRTKRDIILYTRTFSVDGAGPSVECASCHDPHTDKDDNGADVNFMRVSTSGSKICLACHTK